MLDIRAFVVVETIYRPRFFFARAAIWRKKKEKGNIDGYDG